jgi:hypothetical protein
MSQVDTHTRKHDTPPRSSMAMAKDCQKIIKIKNNKQ